MNLPGLLPCKPEKLFIIGRLSSVYCISVVPDVNKSPECFKFMLNFGTELKWF